MLDLSYRRYFVRFSDDYIRDKSSLYLTCKSAKKRIRDCVKISSFLREKVRRALRRTREALEITKHIQRVRAHINRKITQFRKKQGLTIIINSQATTIIANLHRDLTIAKKKLEAT